MADNFFPLLTSIFKHLSMNKFIIRVLKSYFMVYFNCIQSRSSVLNTHMKIMNTHLLKNSMLEQKVPKPNKNIYVLRDI